MAIERFEDIDAWKEARVLTQMVYRVSRGERFARDFKLVNQICSAASSVMNNIAEGFDSQSDKEFIHFLTYARRSATEVQSELYIALDQEYIVLADFETIYQQATKTKKLINGFIRYLRTSPTKETKD